MLTTLYLVRHAQARPVQGQPESEWTLSERGEAQAEALVLVLQKLGIQCVYSSPFRRCRDTLRPFATAAELELKVDDGLRERCLSPEWIGDFREVWRRSWQDFSFALAGGESSLACRARVSAAIDHIVARHGGETIAIGSHGFAIGLFLTTLDSRVGVTEASALRTPDILKITHSISGYAWERTFSAGAEFERIPTDFRATPGIVA